MKRIVSCILCLSLILSISSTAFAADSSTAASAQTNTTTFIDGEGKENTVEITILQPGHSYVEYYIEGVLINTTDTTITEGGQAIVNTTDASTGATQCSIESVSDYIVDTASFVQMYSAHSSKFLGTITYNSFYDHYDTYRAYYLDIYQEELDTTYTYKTINAEAGDAANIIIGVIAGVLSSFLTALSPLATQLLVAAATSAGTSIIGGIIQGLISERYYVHITYYDVITNYPPLSRERTFEGEMYYVALEGGGYSSEPYYDGFLPWDNTSVARVFYETSFGTSYYPGINSFDYA